MKDIERRQSDRKRCSITAEYTVYGGASKKVKGMIKNISEGGLILELKKPLPADAIIALEVDPKRIMKYLDPATIIHDPDNYPMLRVVHIKKDSQKKVYYIGLRFLLHPSVT